MLNSMHGTDGVSISEQARAVAPCPSPSFWRGITTGALAVAALLALTGRPSLAGGYVMLNGPMPLLVVGTPVAGTQRFAPAPLPNPDLSAPIAEQTPGQPQVVARLQQPEAALRDGDGYSPGSAFTADMQNRNHGGMSVAPTIGLKVPLY